MKKDFSYFLEALPQEMYQRTKAHLCKHLAIFEPEEYVLGETICVDDYHFLLFFSEAPVTRVDGRACKLQKSGLLAIKPWQAVYGVPETRKFGKYVHIAVKKDFFNRVAAEAAGGETFESMPMQGVYSAQLLELIGNFQREMMNNGQTYPLMMESICTQIVFQLIRDLNGKSKGNRASKGNEYIHAAIKFMENHYASNISIQDICSMIYLSPCHFKRVFREHTGQTPYRYLIGIRIERSKEMLKKGDHSIEEVAGLCGFVNAGHFSTVFKRYVNLSPTEFRKLKA